MSADEKLTQAVIEAAVEIDGRKKLACVKAFELANRFNTAPIEIGRICNENKIKMCSCQLGCFK